MDVTKMTTEELEQVLRDDFNSEGDGLGLDVVMPVMEKLARRNGKRTGAEAKMAWQMFLQHYLPASQKELIDPTGTKLTPSWHGEECLGNGEWPGYECCCDNCDYYLACFPDWKEHTA